MVRAAAKNHPSVAIVTSPARYADVLAAVAAGGFTLAQRQRLAAEAFAHTATYDVAVATWMGSVLTDTSERHRVPGWAGATWDKAAVLRYGENPHQRAALYRPLDLGSGGLASAEQLHGKEMSYNNYVDTDAARRAAYDFDRAGGRDHQARQPVRDRGRRRRGRGAPQGARVRPDVGVRRRDRRQPAGVGGDGRAGGRGLHRGDRGPGVRRRRGRGPARARRTSGSWCARADEHPDPVEFRGDQRRRADAARDHVDAPGDDPATWTLATGEAAPADVLADLAFAWRACRAVKSNAILLAKDGASVGIGMGQVNRVDSCRLAVTRAGDRAAGSVAASDAFFPFEDGPQILIDAGVRAIVQPGGSMRDELTVEAAKAAGVTMYFTGTRHFFH